MRLSNHLVQLTGIRHLSQGSAAIRWFYATDVPLSKPFLKGYKPNKRPAKFIPFSFADSEKLESQWQKYKEGKTKKASVWVNEDGLFDCDLNARILKAAYWDGPTYEIRRGSWFLDNQPISELLADQIEDAYNKYRPDLVFGPDNKLDKSIPGIKLESEEEKWKAEKLQKLINSKDKIVNGIGVGNVKLEPSWPYKEFNDLANVPKVLYFKDIDKAVLLNKGQFMPKFVVENFGQSSEYLGVYPICRGYKENEEKSTNSKEQTSNKKSGDTEEIIAQSKGVTKTKSHSGDDISDSKFQSFMENDFSNENIAFANSPEREVDHLILAVHGIGQSLSSKYSGINFVHDCNYLRQLLKKEFVTNGERYKETVHAMESDQLKRENCKVQILPIVWRYDVGFGWDYQNKEKLSDESYRLPKLSEISLDTATPVRTLTADVLLDILLYYDPVYQKKILEIVTKSANELYDRYKARHPNFKGKVSVLGHSLGSAIVLDIINSQPKHIPKGDNFDPSKHLKFDVENVFCLGSPNGLFKFLKGINIGPRLSGWSEDAKDKVRPRTKNLYNVFYASDVVAYRMEPMIHSSFSRLKPKKVDVPTRTEVITSKIKSVDVARVVAEHFGWDLNFGSVMEGKERERELEMSPEIRELMFGLNKNGRVDYVLPQGMFDIDIINAMASHIQYFNDADVANFLLGELWKQPNPNGVVKGVIRTVD